MDEGYIKKVNFLWEAELVLEDLKERKKVRGKKLKEIENKLRVLSYSVWLSTPKIKNNPMRKRETLLLCLKDFVDHNRLK